LFSSSIRVSKSEADGMYSFPKEDLEMKLRWEIRVILGLVLVSCAACSDSIGRVVPVKGKASVNGKALTSGSVTFWPDESKGNKSTFEARGTIGEDGTYELYTREKKGAPTGAYKVTITSQSAIPDSTKVGKLPAQLVPTIYNAKESTNLTKEVTENAAAGAYDLDVK
jgi:hypothetical protein